MSRKGQTAPDCERPDLEKGLDSEEKLFLAITRMALDRLKTEEAVAVDTASLQQLPDDRWEALVTRAEKHAVLSLWYELLEKVQLPDSARAKLDAAARKTVQQSYHLFYRTYEVMRALQDADVLAAVLKGAATASVYGIPEYRKSGDIDLILFEEEKMEAAVRALGEQGFFVKEEQLAQHHMVLENYEGIDLELHTMLAEPFDNAQINKYLKGLMPEIKGRLAERTVMGYSFPVLSDGYHAYELLLHMLQHFLRSGFGVKLLCDWVMFWSCPVEQEELSLYLRLVAESGLKGFSDIITAVCVRYLGLPDHCLQQLGSRMVKEDCRRFIRDILEAEEFGKSQANRMVVLRGTGLADYIREFHHQMNLAFPRAGRFFLCWPILWSITLYRFLRNNRRVRGVSEGEIFRKAGERSKLMRQIHLFER